MQTEPRSELVLVDGNAQRAQLVGQAAMLGVAWLLQAWPLVVVTGAVLAAGAIRWPAASLFVQVHERWLAPHLDAVPPIDGRPPRFSAALGAVTFGGIGAGIAAGFDFGWVLVLGSLGAVIAEAVTGRCAPCELFIWAARHNLIRLATPIVGR